MRSKPLACQPVSRQCTCVANSSMRLAAGTPAGPCRRLRDRMLLTAPQPPFATAALRALANTEAWLPPDASALAMVLAAREAAVASLLAAMMASASTLVTGPGFLLRGGILPSSLAVRGVLATGQC